MAFVDITDATHPQDTIDGDDAILQTDWLGIESERYGYTNLDDLHQSNPDLFDNLATEWREDNPWTGLGD